MILFKHFKAVTIHDLIKKHFRREHANADVMHSDYLIIVFVR
jgi:hypothetical protein